MKRMKDKINKNWKKIEKKIRYIFIYKNKRNKQKWTETRPGVEIAFSRSTLMIDAPSYVKR